MSKSNVNPNHYKVAGRERQGEDIAQVRHKQKHAESLARRRSEPDARFQKPAPVRDPASPGVVQKRTAKKATRTTSAKQQQTDTRGKGSQAGAQKRATPSQTARQAPKRASENLQGADKRGMRSTAQKRASSRHDFGPIPATGPVAGAFGKEPSPRRRPPRKR